jgi:hypothetical protein
MTTQPEQGKPCAKCERWVAEFDSPARWCRYCWTWWFWIEHKQGDAPLSQDDAYEMFIDALAMQELEHGPAQLFETARAD